MNMTNANSVEYIFFSISSVTYQPLTNGILCMVELVYWITLIFLPFVKYELVND